MTTFEPGASVVLTQGLRFSPRSTAFFASSAAATITDGLDVLVHDVIAAIATAPWSITHDVPSASVTGVGCEVRPFEPAAADGTVAVSLKLGASEAGNDSSSASSCASCTDDVYAPSAARNIGLAAFSGTRSCGRFGPASEGSTVDRSSSSVSENCGSTCGSCHSPFVLAYVSTRATWSSGRPVKRR